MKVFVTGATGYIGSAVVTELLTRGHKVTGLARTERAADILTKNGIEFHRGDISNPDSVVQALSGVDGVIHTAFNHNFSRYEENCKADGQLLEAIAKAMEGTNKRLIAASATTTVPARNRIVLESDIAEPQIARSASEAFLSYSEKGVHTSVVRLPPSVHGEGDMAFVPALISIARECGVSAFIEKGQNRWPAVHRLDAARLFCDAFESSTPAKRYHAVAEQGIPFLKIADAIGKGLNLPTKSIPSELAEEHFGWMGMFVGTDMPISNEWTKKILSWEPKESKLIESMSKDGYFNKS